MGMESFYGGRQGASFVIVKQFDGIDIPEKSVYKNVYYAIDNSSNRFLYDTDHFIEKDGKNYYLYNWKNVELNGETLDAIIVNTGEYTQINRDVVYQEGMMQCFSQGGDTTDIVNYGEYVIIDTIDKNNPDNGKVFRRGMNIQGELAGAEYIGQIVGPRGETADLDMILYKDFIDPYREGIYSVDEDNEGIVPGGNDDETEFNDKILYRWATVRDQFGEVSDYKIGFRFPYTVHHFIAGFRSPYYLDSESAEGEPGTPITEAKSLITRLDDDTHPFFRKWKLDIPKGIKGDSITEPKIFPTIVTAGSIIYNEVDSEGHLIGDSHEAASDLPIKIESYYDTFNKGYVICLEGDTPYYAALTDTAELHYGYLLTWYDNHEVGDHIWIDIGAYKNIDHVHLSRDGILTVYYTSGAPQIVDDQLTWPTQVSLSPEGLLKFLFNNDLLRNIYPEDPTSGWLDSNDSSYNFNLPWITGVSLSSNGKFNFKFNNDEVYKNNPGDPNWNSNHRIYEPRISWVTKTSLSDEGQFKLYFNNDLNRSAIIAEGGTWDDDSNAYVANIKWVKSIQISEDGIITIVYCDNTTKDVENFKIKKIDDVWIQTERSEGAGEGTGDQKIYLEFNTKNNFGNKEIQAIGNPINYVVETIISEAGNLWNVPQSHLLVWYSDPAYRDRLKTTYPSKVYFYKGTKDTAAKDGWYDLGNVRGLPGGIHIIGNVTQEEDLYNGPGLTNPKKPEDIGGPQCEGWAMTVGDLDAVPAVDPEIYVYDYNADPNKWYKLGSINSSSLNPSMIIAASAEGVEPTYLNVDGFWLVLNSRTYAV